MKLKISVWCSVFLSICWLASPSRGESVTKTTGRASKSQVLLPSVASDALLQHKLQEAANLRLWYQTKLWNDSRWYAAVTENIRLEQEHKDDLRRKQVKQVSRSVRPGFIGDRIANCEGGQAYLHRDHGPTSTASGKYGFLDSTWDGLDGIKGNGFQGYARAMYAPEAVQDAGFIKLWNGGKGASHWSESKRCWS